MNEAIGHNLNFLAQNMTSVPRKADCDGDAQTNPTITLDADHLDFLGTGFSTVSTSGKMPNNGGPVEYSLRAYYLVERGGKRRARTGLAVGNRDVTRLQLADAGRV